MKTFMLFLLLSTGLCGLSQAQHASYEIRYKSKIVLLHDSRTLKGVLYSTADSAIWLAPYIGKVRAVTDTVVPGLLTVPVTSIKSIKIKKRGNVARGIIIGALSGFAAGTLIGLLEGNDPPCQSSWCFFQLTTGEKIKLYGTGLAIPGIIAGGLIGIKREKFMLQGSPERYAQLRDDMSRYSLLEQ